ncbi:MAG: hypothetical protein ACRERE_34805 [Candidatus Entotheonellia bacterium]
MSASPSPIPGTIANNPRVNPQRHRSLEPRSGHQHKSAVLMHQVRLEARLKVATEGKLGKIPIQGATLARAGRPVTRHISAGNPSDPSDQARRF